MSCSTCGGKGQTEFNGVTITCPGCRGFGHELPKKDKPKLGEIKSWDPKEAEDVPEIRKIDAARKELKRDMFGAMYGGIPAGEMLMLVSPSKPDEPKTVTTEVAPGKFVTGRFTPKPLEPPHTQVFSLDHSKAPEEELEFRCLKKRDAGEPVDIFWNFDYAEAEAEILWEAQRQGAEFLNHFLKTPTKPLKEIVEEVLAKQSSLTPMTLKASLGDRCWTVVGERLGFGVREAKVSTCSNMPAFGVTYGLKLTDGTWLGAVPSAFVFGTEGWARGVCDRMNECLKTDASAFNWPLKRWVKVLYLEV